MDTLGAPYLIHHPAQLVVVGVANADPGIPSGPENHSTWAADVAISRISMTLCAISRTSG